MSLLVDNKYIQFFKYTKREAQVFCVIYSEQRIVIVLETHNLKKCQYGIIYVQFLSRDRQSALTL